MKKSEITSRRLEAATTITLRAVVEQMRREAPSLQSVLAAPSSFGNKESLCAAISSALAVAKPRVVASVARMLPPEPPRRVQFEEPEKKPAQRKKDAGRPAEGAPPETRDR
jgi:hypothetical protein